MIKACSGCKIGKPAEEFDKSKFTKDGLGYRCKPCKQISSQKYRSTITREQKDAANARARKRNRDNPELQKIRYARIFERHPKKYKHAKTEEERKRREKESHQRSYERNRKARQASTRKWLNKNPEKKKLYQKRKYAKERLNADSVAKTKVRNNAWKKANPAKVREINQRRRIRKLDGAEDCTDKIRVISKQIFCHWCCVKMRSATFNIFLPNDRTIDHIIPIAREGKHIPDNLVACCRKCNTSRNDKFVHEWTWKTDESQIS